MKQKKFKKQLGFNLIELMVSVGIMSFLFALSAPVYSAWMSNLRVRNISEGIQFGIMQAKSEAIRRNSPVVFLLNNNTSWTVTNEAFTESYNNKSAVENSESVTTNILPNGSNMITFNGFGNVITNLDGSTTITSVEINTSSGFNGVQPLRVEITSGGSVLVCVPSVSATTDDRFCKGG